MPRTPDDADQEPATAEPARRGDAEQDLKATADSIRVDIDRLSGLEDEKAALDPEDPRVDTISDEAVELADRIGRETRVERQLGKELR